MASQREIAAALGLSRATVSRALRHDRRISAAVRERVKAAAKGMGYAPNPMLSGWMEAIRRGSQAGRVRMGLLDASRGEQRPELKMYIEGAQRRSAELGFELETIEVRGSRRLTESRILEIATARGHRGILIAGRGEGSFGTAAGWERFATVAIGQVHPLLRVDRVSPYHYMNVHIAFAKLRERGYRRIGMVVPGSQDDFPVMNLRISAFMEAQRLLPAAEKTGLLESGNLMKSTLSDYIRKERPEVIFAESTDPCTLLQKLGMRIPEDIGVVRCGFFPGSEDWAGIDPGNAAIGELAVETLALQLYHNQSGLPEMPRITLLEGKWQDGHTLGTG